MSDHDGLLIWLKCYTKAPDQLADPGDICQYMDCIEAENALLWWKCEKSRPRGWRVGYDNLFGSCFSTRCGRSDWSHCSFRRRLYLHEQMIIADRRLKTMEIEQL